MVGATTATQLEGQSGDIIGGLNMNNRSIKKTSVSTEQPESSKSIWEAPRTLQFPLAGE
jgi:hypothetical protein